MKLCLVVLFTVCSYFVFGQQKKIDSLLSVNINYKKEDSLKVVYLTNVFRQYARLNNIEKMEEYAAKAVDVAQKLPLTYSLTYVYERLGLCYHGRANYPQAIDAYTKGINAAEKENDKDEMAGLYLNLGALYTSISDYPKALESNQRAVNLYNSLNDQNQISNCYMNIGLIYKDIGKPEKAIDYIEKALVIFKKQNNGMNYGVASAYQTLGAIYVDAANNKYVKPNVSSSEKISSALQYLQMGLAVSEASDDKSLSGSITNDIGNLYQKAGNNSLALFHYQKALKSIEAGTSQEDLSNILLTLGNYYASTKEYQKGFGYLQKSLQIGKEKGLLAVQKKSYESLSNVYEKIGRFDTAMIFFKRYIELRDSIFNVEKEKEITRKQLTLDFSVKENDYKLVQQITDGKLKQQVLLARQQQQVLQLRQQQLQLVNKEKDLQRLTYLKRQAELQNEQQLQASLLQKNTLQSKYDKEVSGKQIAKQQLQISYDGKVKIFLGIAIALALMVTGFIFYSQRKTARLNKIISEQKVSLEQLGNVKDKIFSVVSHDMRAPVNSLISFIDILDDGNIPQQKLTMYAKELRQSLTYTSALMNNLLNWAASQMQGFKPVKEKFELVGLATDVANTLQHHIQQKKVSVVNNIATDTVVNTDRNMMAAMLRNLMSNAIKFSNNGGQIILADKVTETGCTILVMDNGVGMSEAQLAEFNTDAQQPLESMRGTANEKGTGLGLLLCKSFIEQMRGKIKAYKNETGTTFEIWIPA